MEPIPTPPNPLVAESGMFAIAAFQEWFFVPGNWAIYWLVSRAPVIAEVLGVSAADYGSSLAGIVAGAFWVLLAVALITVVSAVRRFDRAVTSSIAYGASELLRHVRMAIVAVRYGRKRRAARKEPSFDGEEPTLEHDEVRALDLHAKLAPGFALAVSDVAEELDLRVHEARAALERLQNLQLLQATVGGLDGETAYTLTANGRALLRLRDARPRPV